MMAAHAGPSAMLLPELLSGFVGEDVRVPRLPVSDLAMDTRDLTLGAVFLALPGSRYHGLDFAEAAVAAGAAAVLAEPDDEWTDERIAKLASSSKVPMLSLAELGSKAGLLAARFHGHPSNRLHMTGITGTNGKTSCVHFLAQASGALGACAMVGTIGNGFPGSLSKATHTTPDPTRLQALLANLEEAGAGAVAMEVSSHALHQHRVAGVEFDVAVFTNLSRDHLDYHRTMEAYAEAKARLFATPGLSAAAINVDDDFGKRLLATLPKDVRLVAYGLSHEQPIATDTWLSARKVETNSTGLSLTIDSSWGEGRLEAGVLGRFNASNLLAVLGVLLVRGMPFEDALQAVSDVRGAPGRMELMKVPGQPAVVIDYAHTPDALEQVLSAVREHCGGRLIGVFGCGGDRDRGKRPQMGGIAERLADQIVLTDDNPRSEDGGAIIDEILAGFNDPAAAIVERDRARAIGRAIEMASKDDWVVVAGKGHEDYQLVGDLKLPFSDAQVVSRILEEGDR